MIGGVQIFSCLMLVNNAIYAYIPAAKGTRVGIYYGDVTNVTLRARRSKGAL